MKRNAFTLIELMLALSLIVVATALIGGLMQMYARNFATRGEDIRRQQLARAILNMIAEDLRSVVVNQEFDASVLTQQLGGGGGASGGGGGSSGGASSGGSVTGGAGTAGSAASAASAAAGGQGGGQTGGSSSSGANGGSSNAGSSSGGGAASAQSSASSSNISAPGIYGSQSQLTLDVSRLPRADEYIPPMGSVMSATLTDVPGDIKNVTYFVQSPNAMGVQDSMDAFNDSMTVASATSGLVRRQLDRAILAYANELGDPSRLNRTGELIAPEVVSLEFSYYDGTQWMTSWDSSTQKLPWLVQITLGMQSATGEAKAAMDAGVSLSLLTYEQRQAYGIEVYVLMVAIPGAQLQATDAESENTAAGMSSMGVN